MKTSHEGNCGEIITRRKTSYHRRPAWPSSPWSWSPRTWPSRGSFGWCSTWAGLALPFFLELNFLNWTGFLVSFIVSYINLNLYLHCFWFWCEMCFGNVEKLKSFDSDTLPRYFSYPTPALATHQPRCECSETIPPSPSIIHMSDEELGCPRNYRQGIFAQLPKFQGSLQKY